MKRYRSVGGSAGVGILLITSICAALPAGASPVTVRFATPTGTSTATCAYTDPCDIVTAVDQAPSNSDITIEAGTYGSAASPPNDNLGDSSGRTNLNIHGPATGPLPVIYSSGLNPLDIADNSRVSRLDVVSTGTGVGLAIATGETASHLIVIAAHANRGACSLFGGTLSDSLCVATNADGAAVENNDHLAATATVSNVTAIATDPNGFAFADIGQTGNTSIDVSNSIAYSLGQDVAISAQTGNSSTLTFTNSDVSYTKPIGPPSGGTTTVATNSTDITVAPKFVSLANADYREAAGSPTIDKGATTPAGDTDLAGNPRDLGNAPDMGAFESLVKPTATSLTVTKKTITTVRTTVAVNPEGLATGVVLKATHGSHHYKSATKSAGIGNAGKTLAITIHGLKADTHYHVYAVAVNAAGHADSAKVSATTHKQPKHHKKK